MKMKKSGCKLLVFSLIVFILAGSVFSAFAVPEDESTPESSYSEETESQESQQTEETYETEATTEESQQTEETVPETEAPTTAETEETVPETEAPTTAETEETAPETEAPTQETYAETEATEKETYAVLDNNLEDLPEADTAPNPTAVFTKKNKNSDLTYGIFSWACVIVGVLTVIIVVLSNKSGYYGGSGKQRYDEGNKIIGQKRLLNDDYYTNRKYNDYQNRDNYR